MAQRDPAARAARRRSAGSAAAVLLAALTACSEPQEIEQTEEAAPAPRPLPGSLEWAAEGTWRLPAERARDAVVHRIEVARLLGLDAADSILEIGPGAGGWTAVLAPASAARGGSYRVALMAGDAGAEASAFNRALLDRFADRDLFGEVTGVELGPGTPPLAEPDSVDVAFSVDGVATWMALGYAEKAFADVYAALEPGGRFGVIAPRTPGGDVQDPGAPNGYVQRDYVVRLARDAGFTLENASELLANPADDRDHPFGVWTLTPYRLTAPLGEPADPTFDRAPYDAIGEPDRMLLIFRKPS